MYCVSTSTDVWSDASSWTELGTGSLKRKGLFTSVDDIIERQWRERFDDLALIRSFMDDWDGEGALAPTPELVDSVSELLKLLRNKRDFSPPSRIVAAPLGSIIVEWQTTQIYFEAEISTPYRAEWMFELPDSNFEHFDESWEPISSIDENAGICFDKDYAFAA